MRVMRRLENALGHLAIPNVTVYLIGLQVMCMLLVVGKPEFGELLLLDPTKVREGEYWRLLTFLFYPPTVSPIWAFFVYYFFWLMGTALEANWGTFRYNLYLLLAAVMSIAAAFLPMALGLPVVGGASSGFVSGSVFLAFAFLYPDFVIRIFFILPVRIKWLALLTWIFYGVTLVFGAWLSKAMVLASIANFLLFFWSDILERMRHGHKQMHRQIKRITKSAPQDTGAFHRCSVCGITDRSHPQMEFRYCTACGGKGYCMEHIATHEHRP